MDDSEALEIMRSGNGRLRPIIDYYATTGNIDNILDGLHDNELRTNILYIISELPKISERCSEEIKSLSRLALSEEDRRFISNIQTI